jgi:hypothetical protein
MAQVIVQDNFLSKDYFQKLKDIVFSHQFPWFMSPVLEDGDDVYMMVHMVYLGDVASSDFFQELRPMFEAMDLFSCMRIKLNMLQRQEKIIEHGMHIDDSDAPDGNLTSIFYMNTNNGYTKFEDGTKIESIENRLITFPVHLKHTGSTNTCDAQFRCVMNINWQRMKEGTGFLEKVK